MRLKKNILLIEKHAFVADSIKEKMQMLGVDIHLANDATRALELAKLIVPDLIIIDSGIMKNEDIELRTKLMEDALISSFPMIVMSDDKIEKKTVQEFGHGTFDYMTKPINTALLESRISSFFRELEKVERKYEEKMDKLRSDITFSLPHEFRTSLSGILGFSNMIAQMTVGTEEISKKQIAEINEMANIVIDSGKILHRLTENFLFYTQLQTTMSKPEKIKEFTSSTTDVPREIIQDVVSIIISATKKKFKIRMNIENASLQMSFFNFYKLAYEVIDNAVKFSESGTEIVIEALCKGGKFEFSVRDQGRGMTAYQIESIGAYRQFGRYLYEQQGAGLGLIIAKLIVMLHKGSFNITSTPGKGTCVSVRLDLFDIGLMSNINEILCQEMN